MTKAHDPTRSAAADALAHKADYGARHAYAIGYEDGLRAAKDDTDDAESYFKRAMDKYHAEKARADAAERMVCELRRALAAIAAPEVGGATTPATLWMERKALAALASTADTAGRWVPAAAVGVALVDGMRAERDAAIARAERAEARVVTLTTLAEKVDAIRNGIVGMQGFHFSEHGYPLVAALDEAGYPGVGYKIARENLGTLIEQTKAAERARDEIGIQLAAAQAEIARLRPVVEAARVFDDAENWEDCRTCDGTGKDPQDHKRRMRCGVCAGSLKVFYDDRADEIRNARTDLRDALAALAAVPGDALAPKGVE